MKFSDWVKASFDSETLADIAEYGASGGYAGITYNADILDLYDRFSDDLWEILNLHADNCGMSAGDIIADAKHKPHNHLQLAAFMVWFAVELLAHELREGI